MACTTTQRRRQERTRNVASETPTVPTVADSCTVGWLDTDIYVAEILVNRPDQRVYTRGTTGIFELTTAIGVPVHGGTNDRILYQDNTASPLLTDDAKFTRDAATNFTAITATAFTNIESGFVVNNSNFGLGSQGAVAFMQDTSTNEIFSSGASRTAGGSKSCGLFYVDTDTFASGRVQLQNNFIQITFNDDAGFDTGLGISDPGGLTSVGKDLGAVNHSFRARQGDAAFGNGAVLFAIRNDGQISCDNGTGESRVRQMFDPGTISAGIAQAFISLGTDDTTNYFTSVVLRNDDNGIDLRSEHDNGVGSPASAIITLQADTGITIGSGVAERIGFYGNTPIIQQTTTSQTAATFVINTSGILNDTGTWDGYTIGDVVAILRAFGLLA